VCGAGFLDFFWGKTNLLLFLSDAASYLAILSWWECEHIWLTSKVGLGNRKVRDSLTLMMAATFSVRVKIL